jgi:hypothetical protein
MASLEEMTPEQRDANALRRLFNHPELGIKAKRLYKELDPKANFPDLDIDDRITAATKSQAEKIEALEQQAREGEVLRRREANHAMIRAAGLDVEQVEKVMTDEKILKYETAINYVKGQSALAPPSPQSVTPIRMPDNMKDIQKNPAAWARNEAFAAINELKAKRG